MKATIRNSFLAIGCLLGACAAFATGRIDAALPAYQPERQAAGELSSIGDGAMRALMDAWLAAFRERQPGVRPGRWEHASDATAVGAPMFRAADLPPPPRRAPPADTAPYPPQF